MSKRPSPTSDTNQRKVLPKLTQTQGDPQAQMQSSASLAVLEHLRRLQRDIELINGSMQFGPPQPGPGVTAWNIRLELPITWTEPKLETPEQRMAGLFANQDQLIELRQKWIAAKTPGLGLPADVEQLILALALQNTGPRSAARLLWTIGQVSTGWSAWKHRILESMSSSRRAELGKAEFEMLRSPSLPLTLLSRFVAKRMLLDDPQWEQRQLPPDCEPRWAVTDLELPPQDQALWCNLLRLYPEHLQTLRVDKCTEVKKETLQTLKACPKLRTVIETRDDSLTEIELDWDWLADLSHVEELHIIDANFDSAWLPEAALKRLKHLAIENPHKWGEVSPLFALLPDYATVEVALDEIEEDKDLDPRITRLELFSAEPQDIQYLPLGLKSLTIPVAVVPPALKRLTRLTELEVGHGPLDALHPHVGPDCKLTKLSVRSANSEQSRMPGFIRALSANQSLEELRIEELWTDEDRTEVAALVQKHPRLHTVYLSNMVYPLNFETMRPMLEAARTSKTLRLLTLDYSTRGRPIESLQQLLAQLAQFDFGTSGLAKLRIFINEDLVASRTFDN